MRSSCKPSAALCDPGSAAAPIIPLCTLRSERCSPVPPDHGILAVWLLFVLQLVFIRRPAAPRPACQSDRHDLYAHLGRYFGLDCRVLGPADPSRTPRSRPAGIPRDNVITAVANSFSSLAAPSPPGYTTLLSSNDPGCLESYMSGPQAKRPSTSAPGRL